MDDTEALAAVRRELALARTQEEVLLARMKIDQLERGAQG